jgi:DNA-directed RNA polymerase specialized sigma24 family protein
MDGGADADLELVRRMQAGDEQALGAFYDRWFPVVSGVVARILRSDGDVEDVIEETFWQAWRQADRFVAGRGSVQTCDVAWCWPRWRTCRASNDRRWSWGISEG